MSETEIERERERQTDRQTDRGIEIVIERELLIVTKCNFLLGVCPRERKRNSERRND